MADTGQIADDFVQLWGRLGPLWGVTPVAARVYAWLVCQAEPQEAEAIGEALGISRGAVSMGCTELVDWRLVHADRATRYQLDGVGIFRVGERDDAVARQRVSREPARLRALAGFARPKLPRLAALGDPDLAAWTG